MRTSWVAVTGLSLSLAAFAAAMMPAIRSTALIGKQADGSWLVVTQQVLRPWRQQLFIKGRPVDLAFNAGKSKLAILNLAGIEVMDEETGAQQQIKTRSTSYCGIAFRPNAQELWSSEADMNGKGSLFIGTLAADGTLKGEEHITFPQQAFPAGIAFSADGLRAFVALNNRNTVAVVDAASKTMIRRSLSAWRPCLCGSRSMARRSLFRIVGAMRRRTVPIGASAAAPRWPPIPLPARC